jgi:hypothetical protein
VRGLRDFFWFHMVGNERHAVGNDWSRLSPIRITGF